MLAIFRRYLNTWGARLFFMVLVFSFAIWGVGDVLRNLGNDGSVVTVAGRRIEMPEVQEAYQRQLAQVMRMMGPDATPTPEIRQTVVAQALDQIILQAVVSAEVSALGIATPDDAVRDAVYAIPGFKGPSGQFDRTVFQTVLRNNNMTEQRFLALVRNDIGQRQLLGAVRAGVASPDQLTKQVFSYQHETRVADALELPFAGAPAPAEPTEAELQRWYDNHKDVYSTPEFRHIRAVVLSPETVAHDVQVTDDDLKAAYEQRRAEFSQPEKRSVEVLLVAEEAKAQALAKQWTAGADWAAMQAAGKEAGASPVELTDALPSEFPSPDLAKTVFATAADAVAGPIKTDLGWYVLKVTKITPANTRTLDQVRDELHAAVVADKAADLIYDRANKVGDLLTGGTGLQDLPGDLGLSAVSGTLDSQGNTPAGQPAPIPGSAALRTALVQAAFQMKKGDAPRLIEAPRGPDNAQAYFALELDDISPPAPKPFADVKTNVQADWRFDAIRHGREEAAAKILAAVKGGQSLADAAAAAGVTVRRLPAVSRGAQVPGVPAQLVPPLFTLKQGEPTMVETADGFMVAQLAQITAADPNADPINYGQVRDALTKAMTDDVQNAYVQALRERAKPRVNRAMVDTITQPE